MTGLSLLKEMETIDMLRSALMFVGVTALLVGTSRASASRSKSRDMVGTALFGESIAIGVTGLSLLLCPGSVMGYVTSGKLDVIHFLIGRLVGCVIIGTAVMSYQMRASPNRNMWLVARLVSGVFLCLVMFIDDANVPSKKGALKFIDTHKTFGMLGAVLWVLFNVCVLSRQSYIANRTPGLRIINKMDRHMLIDLLGCAYDVAHLAYPNFYLDRMVSENFSPDYIHLHLVRVCAVFTLGPFLMGVTNFQTGDIHDKRAYGFGRLVSCMLICPVMLWYFWWYPIFSVTMQVMVWTFHILIMVNLAMA